MFEKNYVCEECGKEFTIQYADEHAYKCGRERHYCPKCVRVRYIRKRRMLVEERKKHHKKESNVKPDGRYLDELKKINKACDSVLERRKARQGFARLEFSVLAQKEDTRKAVEYGESAAKRYMKGVKDGN